MDIVFNDLELVRWCQYYIHLIGIWFPLYYIVWCFRQFKYTGISDHLNCYDNSSLGQLFWLQYNKFKTYKKPIGCLIFLSTS